VMNPISVRPFPCFKVDETGRSCMTKSKPRSRMFSLSRRSDGEDGTWPATV
jgi:hypothetical protein